MDTKEFRVNAKRLQATLEEMAKIGATPGGGVHRLAVSDEDKRARDLFLSWLREIDLEIVVDEMGNIFGKMAGKNDRLAPVLSGSHIDSQPQGGRFDGILGIMGTLEALRTIHENRLETLRPLMIVDWTNEEGTRFSPAMMGSGAWTGKWDRGSAYGRADVQGIKFGEELRRIGYRGEQPARRWPIHAYYELHVEQGPVLEKRGKIIGVPKGVVGIYWFDIYVEGKANQVGPTPMEGRNDALCAAAEMILKVNELPAKMGGDMVATVGEIHNSPNSRNIIPGRVHYTVDIRSWDDGLAIQAWEELQKSLGCIAERRGCPVHSEKTWSVERTVFDERLVKRIRETAAELGYSVQAMVSGAGHDAVYLNQVAPAAMIFVPSIGGRSHVEVENTRWEDCEAGTNVLLQCLLQSASEG